MQSMFERFTSAARTIVVDAQEQARSLDHGWVGTEHLLLALVADPAAPVAVAIGVDHAAVVDSVVAYLGEDPSRKATKGHIPFTPRAKKVLELGLREAIRFGQKDIGAAHIALGIVREGDGMAARALTELGVDLGSLRTRLIAAANREGGPSKRGRGFSLSGLRSGRPAGAGSGPVITTGSQEVVVAALRDPDSAAAKALREKGLDPAELAEAIAAADPTGTSDEPVEQRLARCTTVGVEDGTVVVRVADAALAAALTVPDPGLPARLADALAPVLGRGEESAA